MGMVGIVVIQERRCRLKNHLMSNAFFMNSMSLWAQASGSTLDISLKKKDLNLFYSFLRQLQAWRKSMMQMPNQYRSSSLIRLFSACQLVDLLLYLKTNSREQSITSFCFRKLRFASITESNLLLVSSESPSNSLRNSLLMKFSSFPNRKSLQSRSSTILPSQQPFRSNTNPSPSPRLGMMRKMSSHLLPLEAECRMITAQMGTRMEDWVSLNCLQSSKMRRKRYRSSVLMVLRQYLLDLESAISWLRFPIISDGISSHSLNSTSSYFTSGPFSAPRSASSSQISISHWQVDPSATLNSNWRGYPWRSLRVASMSLRWRTDLMMYIMQ